MIFALYSIDITQICPERHGKAFPAFGVLFVKTTSQTTFASPSGSTRTSSASLPYGSSASAERSCPYVHGGSFPLLSVFPSDSSPPSFRSFLTSSLSFKRKPCAVLSEKIVPNAFLSLPFLRTWTSLPRLATPLSDGFGRFCKFIITQFFYLSIPFLKIF